MRSRKYKGITVLAGVVMAVAVSAWAGYQFNHYRQQQEYNEFFGGKGAKQAETSPEAFFNIDMQNKKTQGKP
jgi:hypothetical protein